MDFVHVEGQELVGDIMGGQAVGIDLEIGLNAFVVQVVGDGAYLLVVRSGRREVF